MHDRSKKRQILLQSYESAMFGKRENISADPRVSSILRAVFFFFKKSSKIVNLSPIFSIYRRFIADFCGDDARPRRVKHTSDFFGEKIGNFRFFGEKSAILPIFPRFFLRSIFPLSFLLGASRKPIFRR